ncbi:MAG: rhodanese-related sulfurtransferase [Proteobacteria bacterium]|nr:rhodanese-related sulfurtransferase [Pseudomonadota bacterium]
MVIVAALYQFKSFIHFEEEKQPLLDFLKKNNVMGTLLIGKEGINGTISGSREGLDNVKNYLINHLKFDDLEYKESFADDHPFYRTKVKLKKEIVTIGVEGVDPTISKGEYLNPKEWNKMMEDSNTLVIDTRNDYEYRIGHFKKSINPDIKKFTDLPAFVEKHKHEWVGKNILMFCTGGIRCEKSTAHAKLVGIGNVYHLKGGILKYLEEIPESESMWEGVCYVFDNRVAVGHGLSLTEYTSCGGCREPLSLKDRESEHYELGVSCPYCFGKRTEKQIKSAKDRQFQINLCEKRGQYSRGAIGVFA